MGMFACMHLIGSLGWPAYVRWVVWFTIGTFVYLFYGIHHSQGESNKNNLLETGATSSSAPEPDADGEPQVHAGPGPAPPAPYVPAGDVQLTAPPGPYISAGNVQLAGPARANTEGGAYPHIEPVIAPVRSETETDTETKTYAPLPGSGESPTWDEVRVARESVDSETGRNMPEHSRSSTEAKRTLLQNTPKSDAPE
eukprot:gene1956-33369_t